jgi:hypothetical protein
MMPESSALNTADLIEKRFGVHTTTRDNPEIAAVGVAALRVFRNNPRRLAAVIVNLSANAMYLALTPTVAATLGIYLAPNGGSITMSLDSDFELVTREWWVIAAGAASALYSLSTEIF